MLMMISTLLLVVILSSVSYVVSLPSRLPKCIDRANPFDWACEEGVKAETGVVALAEGDVSPAAPDPQTVLFVDNFTHRNESTSSGNLTQASPHYPHGLALSYPGFTYSSFQSTKLFMPSPPEILLTDALAQSSTDRQPGIIRSSGTASFDLSGVRFACAYMEDASQTSIPSCLVTFACKPKPVENTGIPSGHRPTPRSMVKSTFEFAPNTDRSSLNWPSPPTINPAPDLHLKVSAYASADLGDEFYDLDHCYIILEQYGPAYQPAVGPPAILIDDVAGTAYYE